VKIIRIFKSSQFDDKIGITEILIQFRNPLTKNQYNESQVVIWLDPNLFYFLDFLEVNDYMIMEGIISLEENYDFPSKNKECEFNIKNFYPYLFYDEYY
jgi:hypothetical protein